MEKEEKRLLLIYGAILALLIVFDLIMGHPEIFLFSLIYGIFGFLSPGLIVGILVIGISYYYIFRISHIEKKWLYFMLMTLLAIVIVGHFVLVFLG